MDYIEKWGTDIDTAVDLALDEMNCSIDEVTVEVLEESTKGFLGLGSKLAKVRVERKSEEQSSISEEPVTKKEVSTIDTDEVKIEEVKVDSIEKESFVKKESEYKKPERKSNKRKADDEDEAKAEEFIKNTINLMGLDLTIDDISHDEDVNIKIKGPDAGIIIGKSGQTLNSLQYITNQVVNKGKNSNARVIIDVDNFRKKRADSLEALSKKTADRVISSKHSIRLEPMNAFERMVIHNTIGGIDKVVSRSEGKEPYRRVIIELK